MGKKATPPPKKSITAVNNWCIAVFKEYLETQHSCRPVINTAGGSLFFVRKQSGSSTKPNILCFELQLGSAYFVLKSLQSHDFGETSHRWWWECTKTRWLCKASNWMWKSTGTELRGPLFGNTFMSFSSYKHRIFSHSFPQLMCALPKGLIWAMWQVQQSNFLVCATTSPYKFPVQ